MFVQYGSKKNPELPNVPLMRKLAKNDADRQALNLMYVRQEYQRPYIAPPGLPAIRVKTLRTAFNATMKDPAYLADAKKRRLDVDPLRGEEIDALIAEVYKTPRRWSNGSRISSLTGPSDRSARRKRRIRRIRV